MNPLSLLAQYESPVEMPEILLLPGLLSVVGIVIWVVFWKREREGGNSKIKWFAFIPLIVAAFLAKDYFILSVDPGVDGEMFRDSIVQSKRLIYGSYLAFLLPVFSVIGFTVWFFVDRKMSKYR